jgi:hypothetical protein
MGTMMGVHCLVVFFVGISVVGPFYLSIYLINIIICNIWIDFYRNILEKEFNNKRWMKFYRYIYKEEKKK